jgi:hypothetical protein
MSVDLAWAEWYQQGPIADLTVVVPPAGRFWVEAKVPMTTPGAVSISRGDDIMAISVNWFPGETSVSSWVSGEPGETVHMKLAIEGAWEGTPTSCIRFGASTEPPVRFGLLPHPKETP